MTQTARLLDYLANHPGATSLEITLALGIVNVTGRISDLRKEGHRIECRKVTRTIRSQTLDGYYLTVEPEQLTLIS
jgi:hypothetical protein